MLEEKVNMPNLSRPALKIGTKLILTILTLTIVGSGVFVYFAATNLQLQQTLLESNQEFDLLLDAQSTVLERGEI